MHTKMDFFILGVLAVILFSILYFSSSSQCNAMRKEQPGEVADTTHQKTLYITSAESEFKDAVAKEITKYFIDQKIHVVRMTIDSLVSLSEERYKILVILNSCWGLKVQQQVEGFLDQLQDQSNIIVLTTYKYADRQPDTQKWNIDSITSASEMAKADSIANNIIEKINVLLKLK